MTALFDMPIVVYLFLGGAGAGLCTVLGVLGLLIPKRAIAMVKTRPMPVKFLRYDPVAVSTTEAVISDALRKLFAPGYGLAGVCILVGIACLMVDLGRLDRVFSLLLTPRLSYVTVGAYALVIGALVLAGLGLVFARIVHHCPYVVLRIMQAASVAVGIVVMLYTGMLLSSMPSVPLWNSWCVPVLFTCSALSCGLVCVVLYAQLNGAAALFRTVMRRLLAYDIAAGALELTVLALYLSLLPRVWPPITPTGMVVVESLALLLQGAGGMIFQIGYVVCGLLLPLTFEVVLALLLPRSEVSLRPFVMFTVALVLMGGFLMRWCVVMAGLRPALMMVL